MGANQSSNSQGPNPSRAGLNGIDIETKKDYYEVLGIGRKATDEEIKKAYRKRALELHPDRNYGNVEETTKLFAEVQAAYEVLSDPQERAWYDSHRDTISLQDTHDQSGERYEHDIRVTSAKDISGILLGFSGRLDYSSIEGGFYSTLRRLFDSLAREEELACEWENLEPVIYPSFGSAEDSHEKVIKLFYTIWSSFSTKKSFSWMDIYRYSEAPDRRTRRMMEKENKRFRDDGIREFNDAVKSLVAFVKRRDPRYIPNTQSEEDRQRMLREAAKSQAARSRAANKAKMDGQTVPQWAQIDKVDGINAFEETEDAQEHYECIVCKKTFKSEKQYEAHERSKKHMKAVQQLSKMMQLEDETVGFDDDVKRLHEDSSNSHLLVSAESLNDLRVANDSTLSINELSIADTTNSPTEEECLAATDLALESDDDASREEIEDRKSDRSIPESTRPGTLSGRSENHSSFPSSLTPSPDGDATKPQPQPKIGKAKEKRARKAVQRNTGANIPLLEFGCVTCKAGFSSKTKLFTHIKDLGHAQSIPNSNTGGKAKKSDKRRPTTDSNYIMSVEKGSIA